MSLFDFKEDKVTVNRDMSTLIPFAKILEREDSDKLFSYIFHLCDWKSPYAVHDDDERKKIVRQEIFGEVSPPKKVLDPAIKLYRDLSTTDSLLLLESARGAVRELRRYFEETTIAQGDSAGRNAKDLIANLKSVGDIIKSFKGWEEAIKREQDTSNIRKGVQITELNKG